MEVFSAYFIIVRVLAFVFDGAVTDVIFRWTMALLGVF